MIPTPHCDFIEKGTSVLAFFFFLLKFQKLTYVTESNEQDLLFCYKTGFAYVCILIQQEAYLSSHETVSTKHYSRGKDCLWIIQLIELFILMKLKATFTSFLTVGLQVDTILQYLLLSSNCRDSTSSVCPSERNMFRT